MWRHNGAHENKPPRISEPVLAAHQPPPISEALAAIDAECACRVGNVSRNTWIVEAIQERLDRLKLSESSSIKGDG